jgi:phosphoribosylformimino-5-aminoimidazole carboxamide ribotide isomerase
MDIIPVIDLMQGQVVHARRGERKHYAPVQSALCSSSEALDIVGALLDLHPFDRIYIADIDAIQRRGHHRNLIAQIRARHPQLEIWLDAGIAHAREWLQWKSLETNCVIGSESVGSVDDYRELRDRCAALAVLSLDFAVQGYRGPQALLQDPQLWPDKVIAMTLAQVGSDAGPDRRQLARIMAAAHGKVFAAGGVRNMHDLHQLAAMGVSGALVASALHAGRLASAEIAAL